MPGVGVIFSYDFMLNMCREHNIIIVISVHLPVVIELYVVVLGVTIMEVADIVSVSILPVGLIS